MKKRHTHPFLTLLASSLTVFAGAAFAQDTPRNVESLLVVGAAQIQDQPRKDADALKTNDAQLVTSYRDLVLTFNPAQSRPGPYLGVNIEPPPDALRSQLKLPEGVGLVVNFLDEQGPAKQAGLRVHDVLQKFDDQILVNPEQLVALVRLKKPGDDVKLTLLREARPTTLTVKLADKVPPKDGQQGAAEPQFIDVYSNLITGAFPPSANATLQQGLVTYSADLLARSTVVGPMTLDDGENVIVVTRAGEGSMIVINKESGKVVFEGPTKTEEQWNAVPESVRKKLEVLKALPPSTVSDQFLPTFMRQKMLSSDGKKE